MHCNIKNIIYTVANITTVCDKIKDYILLIQFSVASSPFLLVVLSTVPHNTTYYTMSICIYIYM